MKTILVATVLSLAACSDKPPQVIVMQQPNTTPPRPPNVMMVNGSAQMEIRPDTADVTLTLTTSASTAKAASRGIADKQASLVTAMNALDVDTAELHISQVTLAPYTVETRGWGPPRRVETAYTATITITATTRKFDRVAAMLEAGAKAGVTQMSTQFRRSDIVDLKKKVRLMALQVAREKAETTAKTLDIALGDITAVAETPGGQMWTSSYFSRSINYSANAVEQAPLPGASDVEAIGGATQTLTLEVNIGYELGKRA
jgi:uncharacterized protein